MEYTTDRNALFHCFRSICPATTAGNNNAVPNIMKTNGHMNAGRWVNLATARLALAMGPTKANPPHDTTA